MPSDEILKILPPPLPFGLDDKVFEATDDKGNIIDELYSYNDWMNKIESMSGINKELLGKNESP